MTRRENEFTRGVRIAAVQRATVNGQLTCEGPCKLPIFGKRYRVDHIVAAGLRGSRNLANAQVLCEFCYGGKDAADNATVKRCTRIEAAHLGVPDPPKGRPMQSRGFYPRPPKESRCGPTSKTVPRRLT